MFAAPSQSLEFAIAQKVPSTDDKQPHELDDIGPELGFVLCCSLLILKDLEPVDDLAETVVEPW